jgi:hypothetical protein
MLLSDFKYDKLFQGVLLSKDSPTSLSCRTALRFMLVDAVASVELMSDAYL